MEVDMESVQAAEEESGNKSTNKRVTETKSPFSTFEKSRDPEVI